MEIAASSVSQDAREKLVIYRRAGVPEYLLWRVQDGAIDWHVLEDDEYRLLEATGERGVLESEVFPGPRLDVPAALSGDRAAVLAALQGGRRSD